MLILNQPAVSCYCCTHEMWIRKEKSLPVWNHNFATAHTVSPPKMVLIQWNM